MGKIADIQRILGDVDVDDVWGPQSQGSLDRLLASTRSKIHHVKASSFADPADIIAFDRCKAQGKTDQECFKVGDNGVGCWGDSTREGTGPCCALPPDDMIAKWGSVAAAKHKKVLVVSKGNSVVCVLKDRMPYKKHIKNGAGIDLNPDAVRALGMKPPIMTTATWQWV